MAVLLIGSTGNGKSALGNFLLNPDPTFAHFEVSINALPTTQAIKTATAEVTYQEDLLIEPFFKESAGVKKWTGKKKLTIIDTPGLNEISEKNNLQHMIDLVMTLHKHRTLQACIFVVKFEATIDQQYVNTIQYYSRLLPELFSKNCIIVQTHYKTDQLSEEDRLDRGIDEDEIKEDIKKRVMEHSCMESEPIIFKLDCRPNHRYVEKSLEERNSILSRIFSHRPLAMNIIAVAKNRSMLTRHAERIANYHDEITRYTEELKKAHQSESDALDEAQKNEDMVTSITADIEKLKERLHAKNTDELVVSKDCVIEKKFLQWQEASFQLESKCEIANVRQWTNGHSRLEYKVSERKLVTGTLKGHGLYASVTLEAKKRDFYAEEILDMQKIIREKEKECEIVQDRTKKRLKEARETIILLQKFNKERRKLIAELSRDYLTIEEAEFELKALQKWSLSSPPLPSSLLPSMN